MDQLFILLALLLPTLLGRVWLGLFVPTTIDGRAALTWGNGLLVGLLVIPILMRALNSVGVSISFPVVAAVAMFMIAVAWAVHIHHSGRVLSARSTASDFNLLSQGEKTLIAVLSALIALRIATLGLELLLRPLTPWDATMHWATKARVWFEFSRIVPFVDNSLWLKLGGEGVFTDHHPGYPITTPLLQVWMASAAGAWNESVINLPWLMCFIALGAAFYGQLRASGAGIALSTTFTYVLISIPLINTHIALAGYADIFLGSCYCCAIMAFSNWAASRQHWQLALALFFSACCPLIKNEGFYWMLTFVPAFAVVLMPPRRAAILLLLMLTALLGFLMLMPGDVEIAGHSLNKLKLHYRSEALTPILVSLWMHDNWHLTAYLLLALLPLSLVSVKASTQSNAGVATALAFAVLLFLILFLFTKFGSGAVRFTAANRISMHIIPALLYFVAVCFVRSEWTMTPRSETDSPQ